MNSVPTRDIEEIQAWAKSVPVINRVWIFGSRARGTETPESDLDIAIEHGILPGDTDVFTTAIGESENWRRALQARVSLKLDLQSYIPGH